MFVSVFDLREALLATNQSGVLGGIILIGLILVYFLPFMIAKKTNHPRSTPIFALNLLLGWTFVGWVAALVWSLSHPKQIMPDAAVRVSPPAPSPAPISGAVGYRDSAGERVGRVATPRAVRLQGDGELMFDIVGESFYDDALQRLMLEAEEDTIKARLVRERDNPHDAFAVAVFLDDEKVGHLDRQHARLFREVFDTLFPDMSVEFLTVGRLIGFPGGKIGVKLDIRLPFRVV
jgi:hypothetical protein